MGGIMFNLQKNNSNNNDWKSKAKKRRIENMGLKKRNKEILKSRNQWKLKATKHEDKIKTLREELKKNF
jgi:hypothetical protein